MDIITRRQAIERGLPHYFTGKLCRNGHIANRTVSRCDCIECVRDQYARWREKHPDQAKFFSNRYYANNRDKSKKRVNNRRVSIKLKAIEYKGGRCQNCGYSRFHGALEFHHRDPNIKDFEIARCNRGWDKIKTEIDKCDLLCANCHREVHWNDTHE